MSFSFLSVISVILFLVYIQSGIYILFRLPGTRLNFLFFLLCLAFAIWSFSYIFVYSASTPEQAHLWDSVGSLGWAIFPALMVSYNMELCSCYKSSKLKNILLAVLLVTGWILFIAVISGVWQSEMITQGKYGWHFRHDASNPWYLVFYIYLSISAFLAFFFLIRWRLRLKDKYELIQFRLYFYPLVFFFFAGGVFDILLPLLNVKFLPNMGHITSLPWIAGITYAIARFQLMSYSSNNLIADDVIKQIKEIVIFVDSRNKIIRSNQFTEKLLCSVTRNIVGKDIFEFVENRILVSGFLRKAQEKGQLGPRLLTLVDENKNYIESNLYFIAIYDRFNDHLGFIIYGHDNNEAINLKKEIIVREQAEKNLRAISDVLELRVKERTSELTESYKELQVKMTEKMRVEEKIKSDIAEKEVLINEIHNRVKNNMNIIISLIMTYDRENLTNQASRKFKELARRVKSLLLVHENLYLSINYSDVDFSSFIRTLTDELVNFYKRKDKVSIEMEVSDVFLDVDYAIPLGLIVNELITNSLQHAFSDYFLKKNPDKKATIHIKYALENNKYEISVADNGKGLPKDFDISELTTNGLPLTEILVKDQINGNLEFSSSRDGTIFKITFLAAK
ncbi:MAG: histidine kinase dimerization/phosphoacceptor domain -containing protein [Cyclobacteriaceae bacterium]